MITTERLEEFYEEMRKFNTYNWLMYKAEVLKKISKLIEESKNNV